MGSTWEDRILSSDAARISPEEARRLIEEGEGGDKPALPALWEVDDGS